MSIQNLYQSRAFRAMAALLLCLVVLTSCGETAREAIAERSPSVVTKTVPAAYNLSREELAVGKAIIADADTQILDEQAKIITVRMKFATLNHREELKTAILSKDANKVAAVLGFSEREYADFMATSEQAAQRWNAKFGAKKNQITEMGRKMGMLCQDCNSPEVLMNNIDISLDKVQHSAIPPKMSELRVIVNEPKSKKSSAIIQGVNGCDPDQDPNHPEKYIVLGVLSAACIVANFWWWWWIPVCISGAFCLVCNPVCQIEP
jgi:hypothetical protein